MTHVGIKLSNEAREIVVFEIFRKHEFGELRRRPYHESVSSRVPRNHAGRATSLGRVKEVEGFGYKRGGALYFFGP